MRVVGILSWFDESPTWLATAITGFARLCDDIVAVDGAYMLYPGGRSKSHPQQVEAIVNTAEAAGCGVLVYQPREVWRENEIEKRNYSLRLAGTLDPDWVVVFDADYHVLSLNPDSIRYDLANTDLDVATYTLLENRDFLGTAELERIANGVSLQHEWTVATRDIYRWNPTLAVGPAHWHYSAEIDGERRWLRGPYDLVDALDLRDALTVYHRNSDRSQVRKRPKERYHKLVDKLGIEGVASG